MQSKTSVFLKVLVNRFHPGINPSFFKSLPQDTTKQIFAEGTPSQNTSVAFTWPYDVISRTHYSWLAAPMEKLPEDLKRAVVNALPADQARGLKNLLKIEGSKALLTPNIKAFLLGQLYQLWNPEDALPREYLAKSSLDSLLSLTKNELVELIDLLAIYDLTEAIRHIVDKKSLKALYLCLSQQKQQFLRICLHHKEKLAAPKLDIDKWDGSKGQLEAILHRRGMLRFGKALCGQSRPFLWDIIHTLDTGRGNTIAEYYKEEPIPGVTNILVQQVHTVINFLKPKSEM